MKLVRTLQAVNTKLTKTRTLVFLPVMIAGLFVLTGCGQAGQITTKAGEPSTTSSTANTNQPTSEHSGAPVVVTPTTPPPSAPEQPVVVTPPPSAPEQPVIVTPSPVVTPPPAVTPAPVTPPPCHQEIVRIPTKVLFVVDTSGSNQGAFFGSNLQPGGATYQSGTDDNKVMRSGVISTFLADYQNNPNFSWGFITFNGTSAYNLMSGLPDKQLFSNNPNKMRNAISDFNRISDQGDTPYRAALNLVYKGLSNDPDLHSTQQINFIVVFLSDGMPTDYASDKEGQEKLMNDVKNVVNLNSKHISFNTIYYGPKDDRSSNRVKQMSVAGKGIFLDTNLNPNGKDFKINDIITIPGSNCSK